MYQTLVQIDTPVLIGVWSVVAVGLLGWSLWRHGWGKETRDYLVLLVVVGGASIFLLPLLAGEGGLPIRGYGVMFLVAMASAVLLAMVRAKRTGLDPEIVLALATWFLVAGIFGARLFYVVEYWPKFQKPTWPQTVFAILNLTQGGLVVYGSLLAGGVALVVFIHKHKLPGLAFTDLIAPGVVLGVGLGRLGCFLNGCCYGGVCELPWAVQFPVGSPPFIDQVHSGELGVQGLKFLGSPLDPPVIASVEANSPAARQGLTAGQHIVAINGTPVPTVSDAQDALLSFERAGDRIVIDTAESPRAAWTVEAPLPRSLAVHPTQLYSFFDAMLLMAFLLAYEPYKRRDGELTALVLVLHPISRFLLESIRVDEAKNIFAMTISQNISIGIFIGGLVLWAYLLRQRPIYRAWPSELTLAPTVTN